MTTTRVFSELLKGYESGARYLDSCGGTRSGKTYAALQLLVLLSLYDALPTITSVVSETLPHLKRGAIRDFQQIMQGLGIWERDRWHDGDKLYTFPNGSIIEFFGADSPGKVHGPGRDRLFVNEAQNIDYETARQLFIRTKAIILIDYNPVRSFWVHEHIQGSGREYSIKSTYRDNPYLTPEQVAEIESNKHSANWWRVYGEGLTGKLEGVIYEFVQVDRMPELAGRMLHTYGLDFGFSNDVSALVDTYIHPGRKEIYVDELIYQRGLLNCNIVERMRALGIPQRGTEIYADAAEPKSIAEIKSYGYNCRACIKGNVTQQLGVILPWRLFVTKRSLNTINELRNYRWMTDTDGVQLNEPMDDFNHALDAMRYAVIPKIGSFVPRGKGITVRN